MAAFGAGASNDFLQASLSADSSVSVAESEQNLDNSNSPKEDKKSEVPKEPNAITSDLVDTCLLGTKAFPSGMCAMTGALSGNGTPVKKKSSRGGADGQLQPAETFDDIFDQLDDELGAGAQQDSPRSPRENISTAPTSTEHSPVQVLIGKDGVATRRSQVDRKKTATLRFRVLIKSIDACLREDHTLLLHKESPQRSFRNSVSMVEREALTEKFEMAIAKHLGGRDYNLAGHIGKGKGKGKGRQPRNLNEAEMMAEDEKKAKDAPEDEPFRSRAARWLTLLSFVRDERGFAFCLTKCVEDFDRGLRDCRDAKFI